MASRSSDFIRCNCGATFLPDEKRGNASAVTAFSEICRNASAGHSVLGAGVYLFKRVKYHHAAWHLLVLAGSACHYFAILWHVRP